ncbi:DNA polymerase III subunits gamma and tau [Photobacterium aphoticum]|uniref:DNA polymerase III subunits gamma and tau n=1 Tax=Photobacterium aphoticum TaxID=754436 RepID=A0A090RD61_9GAMM|nr:DNA polymerase III subunits gamma and tau [Photobacterium aphoticum]
MRDALSLTDQAIALGNGQVQADAVSTMLGTLNTEQALYLLEAVAQGTAEPAMACLEELAGIGVEWDSLLRELAAQLHRVAMHQALPASLDESAPDADRIMALSQSVSPQEVQLCYQIALQGRQDLAFAPDGRTGLEMVLLRMLAFRPVSVSAMAPQPIAVPATQPAAPSASSLPQSGAPQGIERVQALKAQMQQPQQQAVMPQAQPSSPQQQGQQYAPVQQAYGEQPATGQSTMGQSAPQAHGMQPQGMPAQPSAYPQHDYGQPALSQAVPSQPAQQASPQPAAPSAASGLLAARNKLRSQTKRDGNEPSHGKKSEPVQAKKVASSVLDRIASKQNAQASRRQRCRYRALQVRLLRQTHRRPRKNTSGAQRLRHKRVRHKLSPRPN